MVSRDAPRGCAVRASHRHQVRSSCPRQTPSQIRGVDPHDHELRHLFVGEGSEASANRRAGLLKPQIDAAALSPALFRALSRALLRALSRSAPQRRLGVVPRAVHQSFGAQAHLREALRVLLLHRPSVFLEHFAAHLAKVELTPPLLLR